jgi:hypothetical protein
MFPFSSLALHQTMNCVLHTCIVSMCMHIHDTKCFFSKLVENGEEGNCFKPSSYEGVHEKVLFIVF